MSVVIEPSGKPINRETQRQIARIVLASSDHLNPGQLKELVLRMAREVQDINAGHYPQAFVKRCGF